MNEPLSEPQSVTISNARAFLDRVTTNGVNEAAALLRCAELLDAIKRGDLAVYPAAMHGFDANIPLQWKPKEVESINFPGRAP